MHAPSTTLIIIKKVLYLDPKRNKAEVEKSGRRSLKKFLLPLQDTGPRQCKEKTHLLLFTYATVSPKPSMCTGSSSLNHSHRRAQIRGLDMQNTPTHAPTHPHMLAVRRGCAQISGLVPLSVLFCVLSLNVWRADCNQIRAAFTKNRDILIVLCLAA